MELFRDRAAGPPLVTRRPPAFSPAPDALVLYDADCGFCAASTRHLMGRWFRARARPVALQAADLASLGLRLDECRSELHVVDAGRVYRAGAAIAHLLRRSRLPWPAVGITLDLPGIRRVTRRVYALAARNRHRLPGGAASCELPGARN
ncbi:MAG: thiol-disulfide oxidoreductase DCC family protein [Arachnia sp.]